MSGESGGAWGRRLFRLPAGRRQAARDVRREIAAHLELCEADLVAGGLTPEAARAEARRRFGDPEATAAECLREEGARQAGERRRDWWATLRQDLAYAARTLARAPGFTLAAVLTLGLGVGAATAMFGVVDTVLLRALPLPGADRVVALVPQVGGAERGGSPGLLAAWGDQSRSLRAVAASASRNATLARPGSAERLTGAAVSGRFFEALDLRPVRGRALGLADDVPGAPPVVVIGHRLWARAFGGDPRAVGQSMQLDGVAHTIVGVLPASIEPAAGDREFWVPLALPASQRDNFTPYLLLVGRLAPGASAETAARELDGITATLGPRAAEDGVLPAARVLPLHRYLAAPFETPLLLLLAAVGGVLLIGCANVATLVLMRTVGRTRELAVRAALGAGRGRLVRQLTAEHLVIGVLAAAVALPIAGAGTRLLRLTVPAEVPRLVDAGLDVRAFAVALALGVAASLACGVAPALHHRRLDIRGALQGGGRGGADRRGERWRRVLVGVEVALAVVLLAGAAMLTRTARALGRVNPGYDVTRVLTARLALPERDYPELPAAVRGYEAILASVRQQPGVDAAGLVSRVPLGGSLTSVDVDLAERPFAPATRVNAALRVTSAGYFRSIGIPLLAGRDLAASDGADAPPVVVVNAALARRLGGGQAVVGRRIRSDNAAFADAAGRPRELEVVGVVGDVLDGGPRTAALPEFYAPLGQVSEEPWNYWIGRELLLVARTSAAPASAAPALRRAVAQVDARVPLYDVQSTSERLGRALALERFSSRLLLLVGAAGLVLAALGIHAVVAYATSQRTREIGLRLALGATTSHALALVVGQGMRPVLAGLVVGLLGATALARAAAGMLFGVSPLDPASLGGAAVVLAAVAVAACLGPAWRASRVDPAGVLRAD